MIVHRLHRVFLALALLTLAAESAAAQGTFDRPAPAPGGGTQYEYNTPQGTMRVTRTPIVEHDRKVDESNVDAMMGNTGDFATMAMYGLGGLAVLGILAWLLNNLINGRARAGKPDLGGWKPVGGYR